MSDVHEVGINAAHCEFMAEETIVTIIPAVNHPPFRFISGIFGPFESGLPCLVPLWFAIYLRKRGKCQIRIPDWLSLGSLEALVQHEKTMSIFAKLPFHYMEIGQLLLTHAKDDVSEPERVSALLQDLENIRTDRMRLGLSNLASRVQNDELVASAGIANASALEILHVKDFLLQSLETYAWLRPLQTTDN
jgi:GINS complex subunit 2